MVKEPEQKTPDFSTTEMLEIGKVNKVVLRASKTMKTRLILDRQHFYLQSGVSVIMLLFSMIMLFFLMRFVTNCSDSFIEVLKTTKFILITLSSLAIIPSLFIFLIIHKIFRYDTQQKQKSKYGKKENVKQDIDQEDSKILSIPNEILLELKDVCVSIKKIVEKNDN